ncbi:MAG: JAB domain-containing protein [Ruoffia tabacinasalis]
MKTPIENELDLYQVAEIELIYKSKVSPSKRPLITSSKSAYDLLHQHWDPNKICLVEQFKILLLNNANKVLGIYDMASGATTGVMVDICLVITAALKANARAIIISHNHPSGNLKPSEADRNLTNSIQSVTKLLNIRLLDHVIVSDEGYYSFADEGEL